MLLQAVFLLLDKAIALIVLPLNQVGVEQAECMANLGGKPCFLNSDTMTAELLEEVKTAKYTHILLSPELANGDKFRAVVTRKPFLERLYLVTIQEYMSSLLVDRAAQRVNASREEGIDTRVFET
jgi:hypothetical protein